MRGIAVAFQFSGYTLIYLVATCVSVVAALLAFRVRRSPGGWWLFFLTIAITVWSLANTFDYSATTLSAHVTAAQFAYFGSFTPVLFLLFAFRYSGRLRGPARWSVAWLFVVPLASLVAAFTNASHHLLWTGFLPVAGRPTILLYQHGPVYWIVSLYSLGVALLATMVLVDTAVRARGIHRSQSILVAAASVLPWLGGAIYSAAPPSLVALDPSLTFTVTAAILSWSMWRLKLLDLELVPREVIVEEMADGLLVLDCAARILEINPAAVRLLGLSGTPEPGTLARDAIAGWPKLGEPGAKSIYEQLASTLVSPTGALLSIERSPLEGSGEGKACDLFMLRDVTAQVEAERAFEGAYQDLQARMVEIEGLHAELQEQATSDPLTGMHNRRYLAEELGSELLRAVREGYPVSVVMFDVDFFKDVNDTFGHAAGDEMLKAIAAELLTMTRSYDITCRYGGDEFVVVLPRVGSQNALARAESWRVQLAECLAGIGDGRVKATVSMGVATFPEHGETIGEIIAGADRAVYASKSAGGDRVRVAGGVEGEQEG